MIATTTTTRKIFGLYEIDLDGTILYSRIDHPDAADGGAGRNLFTDVLDSANSEEFCRRLFAFTKGHSPADSFNYTLTVAEDRQQEVRVLLAMIRSRTHNERPKSLLVHIRPA